MKKGYEHRLGSSEYTYSLDSLNHIDSLCATMEEDVQAASQSSPDASAKLSMWHKIKMYGTYMKSPKGRYEWIAYMKAIALWLGLGMLVIGGLSYYETI